MIFNQDCLLNDSQKPRIVFWDSVGLFFFHIGIYSARKPFLLLLESRPGCCHGEKSSRSRGLMELHYDSMRKKAQVRMGIWEFGNLR